MRLLAAPDKFRGTATAKEVSAAVAIGARRAGWQATELPLADGGEGTLEALGGANRTTEVTGPLGTPVAAEWRLDGELAVIEMARASGLALAGGREGNDPIAATTRGTGQLIAEAIARGARRIIVGVGGSATTDGGLGAVEALEGRRFPDLGVTVEVACDVTTTFLDVAAVFGPQKGADPGTVETLRRRLEGLVMQYRRSYGVEVELVPHGGAAGGLGGGLFALGAHLEGGFELIARAVGLVDALRDVDLVVTGEGRVDPTSLEGKVVGGVLGLARHRDLPTLIIAGAIAGGLEGLGPALSLLERFGQDRAFHETASCVIEATTTYLAKWNPQPLGL